MGKLTIRGQKLAKANDEFYKILKKLSRSEQEEFLYLITKNYFIPLLGLKYESQTPKERKR